MAIEDADLLVIQKNATSELRKASVSALLAKAAGAVTSVNGEVGDVTLDLQDITDAGSVTTGGATFGGSITSDGAIFTDEVQGTAASFTGELTAGDATFDHLEATDIDGGHKDLGPGEVDYPDP